MEPLIDWNNKTVQAVAATLIFLALLYFGMRTGRDPRLDNCNTVGCEQEQP
jgi:hypothetical protein